MNENDVRKYALLMRELGLTGLEITEGDKTVRLECVGVQTAPLPPEKQAAEQAADFIGVKSPFVGVFYAAPKENAAPYVSVGDYVKKGQTLCVIEAMKMMNEIVAEEAGEICEICAANGQIVEYGTELFRIRR